MRVCYRFVPVGSPDLVTSGLFVAIEGVDGVGKSALAERLGERLQARVFHFPPEFIRFREESSLDIRVPPLPRLLYYIAATAHLSEMVRSARAQDNVVCDRYWASPLSLMTAQEALPSAAIRRLSAPLEPYLERPDLTVLLTADRATVKNRIAERAQRGEGVHPLERPLVESGEFFARMSAAVRRYAASLGPVVEIDTRDLSQDDAASRAWSVLSATAGVP